MADDIHTGKRWNFRFWERSFYDHRNYVMVAGVASATGVFYGWLARHLSIKHYSRKILQEAIQERKISTHLRPERWADLLEDLRYELNTSWLGELFHMFAEDGILSRGFSSKERKEMLETLAPDMLRNANLIGAATAVGTGGLSALLSKHQAHRIDQKYPGYIDAYRDPEKTREWVERHAPKMSHRDKIAAGLEKPPIVIL